MAVGSFSAGLSGLNANGQYLAVIGNNLANINTIGFKSSAVTFMDLVSQTVGGSSANPMQVGLGVVTGSISPVFSQGAIENTREATNVAIQGNGFFVVRGDNGLSYTRAGNFSLNSEGALVTPDGFKVQGYTATDPVTGQIITTEPADRHRGSSRSAAVAGRDERLSHAEQPRRERHARHHLQHAGADLRLGRRFACHDRDLHAHRDGMGLPNHGGRR